VSNEWLKIQHTCYKSHATLCTKGTQQTRHDAREHNMNRSRHDAKSPSIEDSRKPPTRVREGDEGERCGARIGRATREKCEVTLEVECDGGQCTRRTIRE
jgi:hypothetical protein